MVNNHPWNNIHGRYGYAALKDMPMWKRVNIYRRYRLLVSKKYLNNADREEMKRLAVAIARLKTLPLPTTGNNPQFNTSIYTTLKL